MVVDTLEKIKKAACEDYRSSKWWKQRSAHYANLEKNYFFFVRYPDRYKPERVLIKARTREQALRILRDENERSAVSYAGTNNSWSKKQLNYQIL